MVRRASKNQVFLQQDTFRSFSALLSLYFMPGTASRAIVLRSFRPITFLLEILCTHNGFNLSFLPSYACGMEDVFYGLVGICH
jgi:hypothetical protein